MEAANCAALMSQTDFNRLSVSLLWVCHSHRWQEAKVEQHVVELAPMFFALKDPSCRFSDTGSDM